MFCLSVQNSSAKDFGDPEKRRRLRPCSAAGLDSLRCHALPPVEMQRRITCSCKPPSGGCCTWKATASSSLNVQVLNAPVKWVLPRPHTAGAEGAEEVTLLAQELNEGAASALLQSPSCASRVRRSHAAD